MKRILIAEDEPDIRELLEAYLRDAGYETVAATETESRRWTCFRHSPST